MKRRARRLEDKCRIVFLLAFILVISITPIKLFFLGPKDKALWLEGRKTVLPPTFTIDSFLDGSYQNQLEKSLADQTPTSETLKAKYLLAKNRVFNLVSPYIVPKSNYTLVADDLFVYRDSDYLVRKSSDDLNEIESEILDSNDFYSSLPIKNKYIYFITTDGIVNFDSPDKTNVFINKYSSYFPDFKISNLKIDNYLDYEKYFYKNDHHWNYEGSYQGYKDIISLILGEKEKVLKPTEKVTFNYDTLGSKKRSAYPFPSEEKFTAYRFEYPKHKSFIDGYQAEYGYQEGYFEDPELRNGSGDLYYGYFYGPDVSVVKYDFSNKKKGNLIMIGYSDTNAINTLVASHFNKTWVIDTRFCSLATFNKIVSENKIDYLLLVPNGSGGRYIPKPIDNPKGYE